MGNIRPKFLSTIFKKPKWCTINATMIPIPPNRKEPRARNAFRKENDRNNSMVPTPNHINPARNSSTRLFTAGLIFLLKGFKIIQIIIAKVDLKLNP